MEGAAFIVPMTPWGNIGVNDLNQTQNAPAVSAEASLFKDIFKNTIEQVQETQADVEHKQYLLATGQLDDAHTLPIAEAKAGLAVDVMIGLRNKTLEAYNELIKINV
ncbi:MAG: flagellar hook-basal body complex protein FliE [Lachnospiraceae bacterium]|jgi:flagellar hook-basal body complex protein FliE|nr:flagellar hook-basal body complex protein FliE [Lachnospiraceae bacterium]MCI9282532.1 flagellar hook-basal body complex protein FliE [Lachnospiraceae bacterium]